MGRSTSSARSTSAPRSRLREAVGILLLLAGLFIVVALVTHNPTDWPGSSRPYGHPVENRMGQIGAVTSHYLLLVMGYTAYAFALFLLVAGWLSFLHRDLKRLIAPTFFLLAWGLFLPLIASLAADFKAAGTQVNPAFSYGGVVGGFLAYYLVTYTGRIGASLIAVSIVLISLVLTTPLRPSAGVDALIGWIRGLFSGRRDDDEDGTDDDRESGRGAIVIPQPSMSDEEVSPFLNPPEPEPEPDEPALVVPPPPFEPTIAYQPAPEPPVEEDTVEDEDSPVPARPADPYGMTMRDIPDEEYSPPGPDLLDPPRPDAPAETREELLEQARRIVENLRYFNIESEVKTITPGPIVTRFEITLAPGIKVGRVVGLSNDLAMALRAKGGIRIIAPIPGKAAIGIEVPNRNRSTVFIREIVESDLFRQAEQPLVVALGKNTSGEPVVADLAKMPHLLVAGSTGSGKSVCINTILASILMKASPREVRMILVDPKVVELSIYNAIPHLLTPVITDPGRAGGALKWAVGEMEGRYRKLAALGVRDIHQYNARMDDLAAKADARRASGESAEEEATAGLAERLPFMLIIIDEYADLMAVAAKEVEESIARLAQMARAVGIHLILATQRPSADVITGLIKANFPSRIAFKVMQAANSRIILDEAGADKLLGMGDMLFLQAGKPEAIRLHGAFISNDECSRIVEYISHHTAARPDRINEALFDAPGGGEDRGLGLRDPNVRDPLFFEAARLVVRHNQGSVSLLQRRLKVGYARAARLIDQLELATIVSPYDGSKAREVMVDERYLDDMEANGL